MSHFRLAPTQEFHHFRNTTRFEHSRNYASLRLPRGHILTKRVQLQSLRFEEMHESFAKSIQFDTPYTIGILGKVAVFHKNALVTLQNLVPLNEGKRLYNEGSNIDIDNSATL